jgi:hypothetical protein
MRHCRPAADVIFSLEQEMVHSGFISSRNATLLALEKAVMELAAYNLTEGVYYAVTIQSEHYALLRFIETGCYSGFTEKCYKQHLLSANSVADINMLCALNIYTKSDIDERGTKLDERHESIAEHRRNPGTLLQQT